MRSRVRSDRAWVRFSGGKGMESAWVAWFKGGIVPRGGDRPNGLREGTGPGPTGKTRGWGMTA